MNISNLVGGSPLGPQSTSKQGEVNQTDFLNLLTTQLRNQNPLEPVKDAEFLGQLASFSALEESKTQTKAIEQLANSVAANTGLQSLSQASSLIGKKVTYFGEGTSTIEANIVAVEFTQNGLQLKSSDGALIPLGLITQITEQPSSGSAVTPEEAKSDPVEEESSEA